MYFTNAVCQLPISIFGEFSGAITQTYVRNVQYLAERFPLSSLACTR